MTHFHIITLFPKMFDGPFAESIIKRAEKNRLIDIKLIQMRDFAIGKHKKVDDTPCGGGPGMVLKVDVLDRAIKSVKNEISKTTSKNRIILLSPKGERFTQNKAIELSKYDDLIIICGHYEGFDQRIHDHLVDEEISIGDYVLTGGEIPAMVLVDAISRMVPGAIKEESVTNESFMNQTHGTCHLKPDYDYPVYTRPVEYKGWKVPEILQNGNHAKIEKWRKTYRKKHSPEFHE